MVDAHVHVFPDAMFDAIWRYFEQNYWSIHYKLHGTGVATFLEQAGVTAFPTLNYAHKPNISREMNAFTREFCQQHPRAIPFGTVHPGDKDLLAVAETCLTADDFTGLKFQILVTDFYPDDPRLDPVYRLVQREDKIVVIHVGTGPAANKYVGARHFKRLLAKFPELRVQVPHLGCYEYQAFFDLVDAYPNLYLDTAMILVDHALFPSDIGLPDQVLVDHADRLLFGSDFPNIPYPYEKSYSRLLALDLPRDFYEALFYKNARAFYDL